MFDPQAMIRKMLQDQLKRSMSMYAQKAQPIAPSLQLPKLQKQTRQPALSQMKGKGVRDYLASLNRR